MFNCFCTKNTQKQDSSRNTSIPRAYEDDRYQWNLYRVPRNLLIDKKPEDHPARQSAIFVVHGIGDQRWTDTAAHLRSGFEDAFDAIAAWQKHHPSKNGLTDRIFADDLPPPFIFDGYWCDYDNLEKTFPEDWKRFNEREQSFFSNLWKHRSTALRTYFWFLKQQVRLLNPYNIKNVGWYYVLYWPLQLVSLVAITFGLLRSPRLLTRFIADVRLYTDPTGMTERAVVQRIDYRIGAQFLRMLGLDWNFRPLDEEKEIEASGEHITFTRIVWVAHSLGTVISYNVLSDLFHRAAELSLCGDTEQIEGVKRFRKSLRRFVTLGSPLDKIAFLFGKKALRPWPDQQRSVLLYGGETPTGPDKETRVNKEQENIVQDKKDKEWWINFYSVFDPVSGALGDPLICMNSPPVNLFSSFRLSALIPGLAHTDYWHDTERTQRFILGRTYGHEFMRDKEVSPYSPITRMVMTLCGYFFWTALILGAVYVVINWGPDLIDLLIESIKDKLSSN